MSDWSDDTLDQLSALDANIITQSEGDANEPILLRHNGSKEKSNSVSNLNNESTRLNLSAHVLSSRQIDSEPDEDINITLQRFKEKYILETMDSGAESSFDDDDKDKDYRPSKKDFNSSDTDLSISDIQSNSKKTSKKWKKRNQKKIEKEVKENKIKLHSNRIRGRSRRNLFNAHDSEVEWEKEIVGTANLLNTENSPRKHRRKLTGQKILEKVKQRSKQDAIVRKTIDQYHEKRLDNLLACNGFERLKVAADGDCFFNSVKCQLEETITVESMRKRLGTHMSDNKTHYSQFLRVDEKGKPDYDQMINDIKSEGVWKVELADCLPLAVANLFAVPLKIFCSRISTPVYDIRPDLVIPEGSPIILAYSAMHGREHFDSVKKRSETVKDSVNYSQKENTPSAQTSIETVNETTGKNTTPDRESPKHIDTIEMYSLNENIATGIEIDSLNTPSKCQNCDDTPHVTPHKDARFQSPKRSDLKRKRKCTPEIWKRNVRKRNRDAGLEYVSQKGKNISARQVKAVNCSKCRYKCSEKLTDESREQIFNAYWALQDYTRQRDFICQHVTSSQPKRSSGHKSVSYSYFLPSEGGNVRVCRSFFINTLNIGKKTVQNAMKKKSHGVFAAQDERGRFPSANKTSSERLAEVRRHIESVPRMESHYVRKTSKRQYLSPDLSIRQMWEYYKESCKTKTMKPVAEKTYRDIFCTEYNLSFYKPKKDQCSLCNVYEMKKKQGTLDENMEQQYADHHERKRQSRDEKEKDKEQAQIQPTYYAATFDLQAVLSTPCSLVGELFYKRKLACYNLSFYSLGDQNGTCYLWDECQAGRGSCEIATCLQMHTNSVTSGNPAIKEITYFSDTCGGQNRNQFVASSLIYSLHKSETLDIINHKFFERGHSHMESDTIHSSIEHAKKNTPVYVPSNWNTVILKARQKKPYIIVPVKYRDIMDFKSFSKDQCPNMKCTVDGDRVNWLKVKWIQVRRSDPRSIFLNNTFDTTQFVELKVQSSTRGRPQQWPVKLAALYTHKLPISEAKKKDLVSLCQSGIIPEDCQGYYYSLPTKKGMKDRIPVPDPLDTDSDSEYDGDIEED